MKERITDTIRVMTVLVVSFAVISPSALAAPAASKTPAPGSQGQALEIAPPVIYLTANPGQTITTQIFLRDISSGDLIVTGQTNDFVASGEDGTPKVILNDDSNNPYSLKSWVVPPASLNLVPHEIKTMNITVNVPANASPGGHYGVIRFTATPPSLKDTGVSLSASLGSLVLLTVNGNIRHDLVLKDFSVSHGGTTGTLFESGPVSFTERLQNTGNVHEQPSGEISVTNMFNKPVGSVGINHPPKNILPSSTRKFEQALDSSVIGNKKLFGRYKASLKITYDKKTLTATKTFWVIPYRLIIILALLLVAAFFALRALLKRYNRRVIEKAQAGGGPKNGADADKEEPAPQPKAKDTEETKDDEPEDAGSDDGADQNGGDSSSDSTDSTDNTDETDSNDETDSKK